LIFVGEKRSGKSSLVCKFLDEPINDKMKETAGLEFKFGVKYNDDKRQKISIYELGNLLLLIY